MFTKAARFIRRYLFRHPIYVLVYGIFYLRSQCIANVQLYDRDEVAQAIRQGKSIIRFGDGEINLFLNINNHYQKYTPALAQSLKNIILSNSFEAQYVLAVPRFLNWSNVELKKINRKNLWLPFKVFYSLMFKKNLPYIDAHCFYYDNYFETVIAPALPTAPVVILTNKQTIESLRQNKELPWSTIRYIECPECDAFEQKIVIENQLDAELATLSMPPVILIALGPVGKCLAFTYSHKGYQCIDIGRGIERIYTDVSLEQFAI